MGKEEEKFKRTQKAVMLLLQRKSNDEIIKEAGLSGPQLGGISMQWKKDPQALIKKYGLETTPEAQALAQAQSDRPTNQTGTGSASPTRLSAQPSSTATPQPIPVGEGFKLPVGYKLVAEQPEAKDGEDPQILPRIVEERKIPVDWTGIGKQAEISPKVLFWFDYARAQGYNGNFGVFLEQCVNDYFKRRGLRIVVARET